LHTLPEIADRTGLLGSASNGHPVRAAVGVGVLLALCSSLLQKSIKGGFVVAGGLNLGGFIETILNPVAVVEIAIQKGAASILMPIDADQQPAAIERVTRRSDSF
jgi:predicted ATP-dependent Lon-type protease